MREKTLPCTEANVRKSFVWAILQSNDSTIIFNWDESCDKPLMKKSAGQLLRWIKLRFHRRNIIVPKGSSGRSVNLTTIYCNKDNQNGKENGSWRSWLNRDSCWRTSRMPPMCNSRKWLIVSFALSMLFESDWCSLISTL